MKQGNIYLNEKFLSDYDASVYERPNTTVDVVIFTIRHEELQVLVVKRANAPFKGCWSLVGGYVDIQKDANLEATAKRKLEEKTFVKTPYLEQCETIGNRDRDPRGWSITTVYFALIPYEEIKIKAGQGIKEIKWLSLRDGHVNEKLAFDHEDLLMKCIKRLRNKILYTSLPMHLMPEK